MRFAANYEHAQSLLRPVAETLRLFTVDPGGGSWIVDNGRNLRVGLLL
jgi:flavin-dependent dehydrogenase